MAHKVFLLGKDMWLYCDNVSLENGIYNAWVINGGWHLRYDVDLQVWYACVDRADANNLISVNKGLSKLEWACDPDEAVWDYNYVIADAKHRYENGEPANFVVSTEDKNYKRYLKLKEKYDTEEYELYLELCEKYEADDDIPF